MEPDGDESELSSVDKEWLDNHLARIRHLIAQEAVQVAKDRDAQRPEGMDVAEAAKQFAPGVRFPGEPSFSDRIKASLSGITLVSGVLAVVFGVLGVYSRMHQGDATPYFDIVKLFAGAIVGSTGAGVALSTRRK
jgi:hypothetical protein